MKEKAPKIAFVRKFTNVPRTLRMAKILARAGYTVHIIEWDRVGTEPKTEFKDGILFKRLKLKSPYSFRSFYLIPFWLIYASIQLIAGNYDIIQPQNLDCMLPALPARLIKHARIIYDMADFYRDAYLIEMPIISSLSAILERLLIRKSDALILSSEHAVLQIEEKNIPAKKIMFYNSPNVDFEVDVDRKGISDKANKNKLTLFYPGLLNYDRAKPLLNVIKSVKDLPVEIVIVGFGECTHIFQALSKTNKQLTFLGYMSHRETLELSKKADIMLLTYDAIYANNRIGLPNKLFEAMACGNLILAPRHTYMGEIVTKEKIGIAVDYNNPTEIREAIKSFLDKENSETQLAKKHAKELYIKKYNPEKMNSTYLETVKSLHQKA